MPSEPHLVIPYQLRLPKISDSIMVGHIIERWWCRLTFFQLPNPAQILEYSRRECVRTCTHRFCPSHQDTILEKTTLNDGSTIVKWGPLKQSAAYTVCMIVQTCFVIPIVLTRLLTNFFPASYHALCATALLCVKSLAHRRPTSTLLHFIITFQVVVFFIVYHLWQTSWVNVEINSWMIVHTPAVRVYIEER